MFKPRFQMAIVSLCILLSSCQEEDKIPDIQYAFGTSPVVTEISASQGIEQGDSLFAMQESFEVLTSPERYFYVDEPLTVRFKNGKLEVRNFMAHDFKEVTVLMTTPYLKDTILLALFREVPAFYEVRTNTPLSMGEQLFATTSGRPVRTNNLQLLADGQYKLHIACPDTILDKVRANKMHTLIQMGKYDGGSWVKITPPHARLFCAATVNFTCMLSSDIFADSLLNYKGCSSDPDARKTVTDADGIKHYFDSYGKPSTASGSIHDDAGVAINRPQLLSRIRAKEVLNCGSVSGVAGLGGGSTFGIGHGYCYSCFYSNRLTLSSDYVISVMLHEFGHCIGYSHGSSLAANGYYQRFASVAEYIAPKVYRHMMKNRMLPYLINPFKKYNDYDPEAPKIQITDKTLN